MIYLAVDIKSTLIKIGFSDNPRYREKQLQTANPNFHIFFIFLGGAKLEKTLHNRFQDFRYDLEWFSLSKSDIYSIITEFEQLSIFFDDDLLNSIEFISQRKVINLTEQESALLKILTDAEHSLTDLARNLFIAEQDIIKLLNQLKKKKALKYTKKGYKISVSVNQAGCGTSNIGGSLTAKDE